VSHRWSMAAAAVLSVACIHLPPSADTGLAEDACVPDPLPDDWSFLTVSPFGTRGVHPGDTSELGVLAVVWGTPQEVRVCETWAVDPPDAGVSVVDGRMEVDPSVPDGTEIVVTARVRGEVVGATDDVVLSTPVFVFDPALRPWAGMWQEVAQIDCVTGQERVPASAIGEIAIGAEGEMRVTWSPFEVYVDYRADHGFSAVDDPRTGTVSMTGIGGNHAPPDIDGEGTYRMDGADLILEDLWLGTPRDGTDAPGCGHRLR
jgi:hypothetical protein